MSDLVRAFAKRSLHIIYIRDAADYSEAWDLARTGGEDNMGYNAMAGWVAVADDVLAVEIKLRYG